MLDGEQCVWQCCQWVEVNFIQCGCQVGVLYFYFDCQCMVGGFIKIKQMFVLVFVKQINSVMQDYCDNYYQVDGGDMGGGICYYCVDDCQNVYY